MIATKARRLKIYCAASSDRFEASYQLLIMDILTTGKTFDFYLCRVFLKTV